MDNFEGQEIDTQIIQTEDEDGNLHNFELIDVVEIDNQEYGVLLYLNDEASEEDEQEIAIMRLIKQNDNYIFETIESEEEFNRVSAMIEAELNEEFDEELEDEE